MNQFYILPKDTTQLEGPFHGETKARERAAELAEEHPGIEIQVLRVIGHMKAGGAQWQPAPTPIEPSDPMLRIWRDFVRPADRVFFPQPIPGTVTWTMND